MRDIDVLVVADLDVLVVADLDDLHAHLVQEQLTLAGASVCTLNLSTLRSVLLTFDLDALTVHTDDGAYRISSATSVWWRRAGMTPTDGLDQEEANLVTDENPHLLLGVLDACGVRWIDHPYLVARAERKLYQLSLARQLGFRIPETLATNEPKEARKLQSRHSVISKPISPGLGIAPFTDKLESDDIDALKANPALIQELVEASADVRVVVVDGESWSWVRPREEDTLDWRAVDPMGSGFNREDVPGLASQTLQMTAALDLTMSVQDWLITAEGTVFLEVNPQGNWNFLPGANTTVTTALAAHLLHAEGETEGEWPSALRRFLFDFRSAGSAPSNDGIVAPLFASSNWVDEVATWDGALDVARRANDAAQDSATTAEAKASRLVRVSLVVITIAVALATFQLTAAVGRSWPWFLLVVPSLIGVSSVALAAAVALQVDRVGFYSHAHPAGLRFSGARTRLALALEAEERGRKLARWTAKHKIDDLMQARAWFSRGLAAVLVAALIAGTTFAFDTKPELTKGTSSPSTTTSTIANQDPISPTSTSPANTEPGVSP